MMDNPSKEVQKKGRINVLYLIGFLDQFGVSMGISLTMPVLAELGASPTLIGAVGSMYGGLQLFISPIYGKWSDEVGRRVSLTTCMIFISLGYSISGVCTTIPIFFVSRFILGCFKHSMTIAKACLSDLVTNDPSCHSTLLGRFNSFSSVGFILGPVVGGHLAETSGGFPLVAMSAGALFMFNAGAAWWMILPPNKQDKVPEDNSTNVSHEESYTTVLQSSKSKDSSSEKFSIVKFFGSFADFNWQELWDLMLVRFLSGFSMIMFHTNFAMVLKLKFSASPSVIGYMTSFSGVVSVLSGFAMGPVIKSYNDDNARLLFHAMIFQAVSLLSLSIAPSYTFLLLALVPLNLVTAIARVSRMTLTVEAVSSEPAQPNMRKLSDPSIQDVCSTEKTESYRATSASHTSTTRRTGAHNEPEGNDIGESRKTSSLSSTPSPIAAVLGVGQSVTGVARMVAPMVIGLAQEVAGIDAPGYISVVFAVLAVGVMVLSGRAKLLQ